MFFVSLFSSFGQKFVRNNDNGMRGLVGFMDIVKS